MIVTGKIPERVTRLRASTLGLVTMCGEFENGDDVLIPLVDWQLFGDGELHDDADDGDVGSEIGSHLVALDNMAFIVNRISKDLRSAVRLLVAQSGSGIAPSHSRTDYTERMLRTAAAELGSASNDLRSGLLREDDGPDVE